VSADLMAADEQTARDRARVVLAQPGHKMTAYISSDGQTVTNFLGVELMSRVTWGRQHSRSDTRRHLTAVDPYGRIWAGTGDEGMWCCLRLTAKAVRR
jgi:type VI protein secretion system component VasK